MVQKKNWSQAKMSSFANSLQHFLDSTMSDAMEELDGKLSIGGRTITNIRFADYIDSPEE